MGLVDGEQGDAAAREQGQEAAGEQALGGDVEHVQVAGEQFTLDPGGGVAIEGGVEVFGAHAQLAQGFHLVLHEGDKRGDDDAGAVAEQGGHLVAQRLAAAGGHQYERVIAGGDMFDDRLLRTAEIVVTKDAAEQVVRGAGRHRASLPRHAGRPCPPTEDQWVGACPRASPSRISSRSRSRSRSRSQSQSQSQSQSAMFP
ncbi:hypothetical protein D3C71_1349220 [compost metagenome]